MADKLAAQKKPATPQRKPGRPKAPTWEQVEKVIEDSHMRLSRAINLLTREVRILQEKVDQLMSQQGATQADLDALAKQITDLGTTVDADVTGVHDEIAALNATIAANPGQPASNLSLQGVTDALAKLGTSVSGLTGLLPQVVPTPAPAAPSDNPTPPVAAAEEDPGTSHTVG